MSLESFKRTSLTWNRANDTLNKTPIEIVAGDTNARTLELYITNDGYADALTGYDVRLYWSYADTSSAGTATFIADKLNQGIYTLTFPTEMTVPGTIIANISLENKDEKSVIVSKQITFNVLTSQLNETAVEVTNRIDEFKQLLLTIYPNSVATELSAQKAQIDANASNILLKANDSDLTNLKNQIDQISSELTSFGITPKQITTIQSLLAAIENDATDADVTAVISSLNSIKSQVDAMANGSYTAKANKTDLDSLTQTVNNQGASIATKRDINTVDTIAQGGTNASTRPAAFNNLSFIGTNPITSPSDDTPANWNAFGSGYAFYAKNNALNNQPNQYGHLIQYNFSGWTEFLQIFSVAPTGQMFYRRANGDGWGGDPKNNGTWTRLSDSQNPIPVLLADASSTGMSYTITNSMVSNRLPNGYTFKFIPNVNSSTPNATLAINGGTAYPFYKIDTYEGTTQIASTSNSSTSFLQGGLPYTLTYWNNRWIILEQPLLNVQAAVGTLPIANGGTGTSDGFINTIAYANSADGTDGFTTTYPNLNLLTGTSNQVVQANDWNMKVADIKYDKSLGGTLCASVVINNADHASVLVKGNTCTILKALDKNGNVLASANGNAVSYNANGLSQCSISINDNTANVQVYIWTNNMQQNAFYSRLKLEKGSVATPWMPSSSEVTTADYPKYVGFSNVIKPNKTSSDYKWLPMGMASIDSATGLLKPAIIGVDYAQPHPVGSVISNTSSELSGYTVGSWSLIGSTTIYPNFNLLKNTRNLSSTSTTTSWGTLFNSSQVYDSGIKSLSGVSALTFSFDVYIPLNATVGDVIPIQLKGQNSKATNVGVDDFNTIIGWVPYVIKQSDLGKTIRASSQIQKGPNYQSFDTALADTSSITIRQSTNISGLVYSNIKLELGSTATPYMLSQQEVATTGYPTDVGSTTVYYWKRTG